MSKNVAVFVDVANIFYAAKAAGVDIDYVTLLKAGSAGRDLVRAYAYTGLDPENENQRNFHDFLRRHGYKVVSKDIRKYGDGKVKANLDIELVVDMMKTARNLDIAIVVSGDGDFAPAIRAVQEMGVRVEVVSFRGNTSSDLIDVADIFTDITQIAKVEKGSSRSGRRVADDEEDLSMTEVPEKQSEGSGESRRGRGRSRSRSGEGVAAAGTSRRLSSRSRAAAAVVDAESTGEPHLTVLPGEKLSRVGPAPSGQPTTEEAEAIEADADAEAAEPANGGEGAAFDTDEGGRRRRRRRGGRGRGRGRRDEALEPAAERSERDSDEDEEFEAQPARRPAASTFGSVWDSQMGVPAASAPRSLAREPLDEDEDLDEPPIPEYLIAERRQQNAGGRGGGGRGRGSAYAAAMDRERFGGGRGTQVSRFAVPAPRRDSGPNRFDRGGRGDRSGPRSDSRPMPRSGSSEEPWTEVPPEIEAMLRAQLAGGGARPESPAATKSPRRTTRSRAAAIGESIADAGAVAAAGPSTEAAAPKRRATRSSKATATAADTSSPGDAAPDEVTPKPTTRRTSRAKAAAAPTEEAAGDTPEAAAPKRRTRRTADASA